MPDETRSLAVEQFDDRVCKARELVERGNYLWRNFGRRFVERYLRGELDIVVRRAIADEAQYGFLIRAEHCGTEKTEIRDVQSSRGCGGNREFWRDLDAQQPPMLTHDVELMEGEQRFVPSLIRFQRFNARAFAVGKPLYQFTSLEPPGGELVGAPGNGKIRIVWSSYAVAAEQCSRENIETAPQGVDVSADLDIEIQRERAFQARYYRAVRDWRFRLFDTVIRVVAEPGVDPLGEGWQLGYGPVNTCLSW